MDKSVLEIGQIRRYGSSFYTVVGIVDDGHFVRVIWLGNNNEKTYPIWSILDNELATSLELELL